MTEQTVSLTLAEARELLAASVAHQACELDVPALLIKGPTLQAHGLRGPRESIDVDLWASPAVLDRLLEALRARGWHPYEFPEDTTAHLIVPQSITLIHRSWPLELDLHHRFPGFLAEPQVVFDCFWGERNELTQAGQRIAMPDLLSSILIAALHYERNGEERVEDLGDLLQRTRTVLRDDQLHDLANLADRTGCADTLRTFLDDLGAPAVGVGRSDPDALAAWHLHRHGGALVTSVAWLEALRRARWRDRPTLLWRALLFTEDELRFRHPEAPQGRRGVWLARYWRLRDAIRELPLTVRVLRDWRRTKP